MAELITILCDFVHSYLSHLSAGVGLLYIANIPVVIAQNSFSNAESDINYINCTSGP